MENRLILASKSPRRYDLLKQVGLNFDVIPSRVIEDFVNGETPRKQVIRLAEAKTLHVGTRYPDRWVIAADTVVCVNGSIFGKPKTQREAMEMLRCLSGQKHWVLTGFSVKHVGRRRGDRGAVRTAVKVRTLVPAEMEWYVKTGEPFDKAGGYALPEISASDPSALNRRARTSASVAGNSHSTPSAPTPW